MSDKPDGFGNWCPDCGLPRGVCTCETQLLPADDPEPEAIEYDAPLGDPCPHCQSTLTDDVATIWQDEDLICLAHQCFWCGQTFETVKPYVVEPEPIEDDDIPF